MYMEREITGTKREGYVDTSYRIEHDEIIRLNLLTPQTCVEMVQSARRATAWQPGQGEGGVAWEMLMEGSACENIRDECLQKVLPVAQGALGYNGNSLGTVRLLHYYQGGRYDAHRDNLSVDKHRKCTIVVYLNDDYRGGETDFPELKHTVRPRSGTAILFPAYLLHAARVVRNGNKYVAVAWLRGPRMRDWI